MMAQLASFWRGWAERHVRKRCPVKVLHDMSRFGARRAIYLLWVNMGRKIDASIPQEG